MRERPSTRQRREQPLDQVAPRAGVFDGRLDHDARVDDPESSSPGGQRLPRLGEPGGGQGQRNALWAGPDGAHAGGLGQGQETRLLEQIIKVDGTRTEAVFEFLGEGVDLLGVVHARQLGVEIDARDRVGDIYASTS